MAFLHGVETIEVLKGPQPIQTVRTAVIGLVGIAPVHHVAAPAVAPQLNKLSLFLNDRDQPNYGPNIAAYNIPDALQACVDAGVGTVLVVNVFDPAVHKTTVAAAARNIVNKVITLADQDIISAVVTKLDDTACVLGVDYTIDRVKGTITVLAGGNLAAAAQAKVGYDKANPGAVVGTDVIGTIDGGGHRTGMQAWLDAASLFGFGPKLLIAPGYSGQATVAAALKALAAKAKLRAMAIADAPVGTSRAAILASRAVGSVPDLSLADERLDYAYPYVDLDGKGTLAPYSTRSRRRHRAHRHPSSATGVSPSNKPILGHRRHRDPAHGSVNDRAVRRQRSSTPRASATVFTGFGLGLRPGATGRARSPARATSRRSSRCAHDRRRRGRVRRARDAPVHVDGVTVGDVLIDAVLERRQRVHPHARQRAARSWRARRSSASRRTTRRPSSPRGISPSRKTMCPPPPAERITYKDVDRRFNLLAKLGWEPHHGNQQDLQRATSTSTAPTTCSVARRGHAARHRDRDRGAQGPRHDRLGRAAHRPRAHGGEDQVGRLLPEQLVNGANPFTTHKLQVRAIRRDARRGRPHRREAARRAPHVPVEEDAARCHRRDGGHRVRGGADRHVREGHARRRGARRDRRARERVEGRRRRPPRQLPQEPRRLIMEDGTTKPSATLDGAASTLTPSPSTEQPSGDAALALEAERAAQIAEEEARTGRREFVCTSGLKAQILIKGKGKHLRQASRMAGNTPDQMTFSMAMVAVKALIEGKAVVLEDLLEMDDTDVLELIGAVMGGKAKGT
jgi:hypothetical protein